MTADEAVEPTRLAGVRPCVAVTALDLGRALKNAIPFLSSEDDVPVLRCVHLVSDEAGGVLVVQATDRVALVSQPLEAKADTTLNLLLDRDDAQLVSAAVASALKTTLGDKEYVTARLRLTNHSTHAILTVEVGTNRVDVQTVNGRPVEFGKLLAQSLEHGTGRFDVLVNGTILARLGKVKAKHKAEQGHVRMHQRSPKLPIRCELPDDVVVLVMPRVEDDVTRTAWGDE